LNWYFGTTVNGRQWNRGQPLKPITFTRTSQSRIQIVRTGAAGLVDILDERLRVGLTHYNPIVDPVVADRYGGIMIEPLGPLGGASSLKRTVLKTKINAIVPAGPTPLAGTLSDIGRYFARGYTGNLTTHPGKPNQGSVSVADFFDNRQLLDPTALITENPVQFSCQRSFAVLLTDGRPQFDQFVSSHLADYDQDCTSANGCTPPASTCPTGVNNPIGCDKKTGRFYETRGSDYLDDVAKALREIDLRPDFPLEADGTQFKNNVTSYLIGFADPAVQDDPLVKATGDAEHGGGGFYPASDAAALNDIFANIGASILKTAGAASAVSLNASRLEAGSMVYQSKFNSGDWSGDLQGFKLSTGAGGACPLIGKGLPCTTPEFSAAARLNTQGFTGAASADRAILSYNPGTRVGTPFRWANLTQSQRDALNSNPDSASFANDTFGSLRLDYLRGARNNEGANSVPSFRTRGSVLGDLVNSDPAYVAESPFSYGFSGYATFRTTTSTRKKMVYVGANDGMLHGFDAATGQEDIAYVPSKLFGVAGAPKLAKLTQRLYTHQYGVDGSPVVGDAFIGTTWKSVLVSGLRSGGQGIFALNVTDPSLFAESKTDTVMWEFNDTDDADLGYTFSKPSIVQMANGKWAAIIGNGYNNTEADGNASGNGKAALFIVFLDGPGTSGWVSGTHYIKLLTNAGTSAAPNGLATPAAVDVNRDDKVDFIYAGDELGNLWRFDVSSPSSADWKVAYGNKPVFTATDNAGTGVQPITARPEVGFNLLQPSPLGSLTPKLSIYFGTGRYIDALDNSATGQVTQTFYGIFDDTAATTSPAAARADLLQQTILNEVTPAGAVCAATGRCLRITSNNSFPAGADLGGKKGWFIDLLNTGAAATANNGERQITTPVLRNGKIIFTTLTPSANPCVFGGGGFLMEMDAKTGARLSAPTLDINGDGVITEADNINVTNSTGVADNYTVSGDRSTVGILSTPNFLVETIGTELKYMGGSTAAIGVVRESSGGRFGRISWREIIR